jgi:hypothetical protein
MCPRGGGIVISLVLSVAPAEASVITTSPATIWNTYSRFRLATYHTGKLSNVCFIKAPWGPYSWGIEASTFSALRVERWGCVVRVPSVWRVHHASRRPRHSADS